LLEPGRETESVGLILGGRREGGDLIGLVEPYPGVSARKLRTLLVLGANKRSDQGGG
jgi:uncharacterized protein (DUF1501 family)